MDIMVCGKAENFYVPNEVTINLDFNTVSKTYDEALKEGTSNVELFICEVLEKMNFKKEDLKTRSFRISEEIKYDYEAKKNIKLGFVYRQNATIKFDYSMEKISEFMERVSKLEKYPNYILYFNLKNEETCKAEVTKMAYEKAKQKAENIAMAAGKILKDCIKTDFKPFEESVSSVSMLEGSQFMRKSNILSEEMSVQDTIKNIFTPEDVCVSETLYCLWRAE